MSWENELLLFQVVGYRILLFHVVLSMCLWECLLRPSVYCFDSCCMPGVIGCGWCVCRDCVM